MRSFPFRQGLVLSRCGVGLLSGLVLALALTSPAQADGGASIAAAPTAVYGQQEFGSLASGVNYGCTEHFRSWWVLPVTAGDAITIDWEAQDIQAEAMLYAPGTTDFTFPTASPLVYGHLNDNHKAELAYTTTQSGDLLLEFYGESEDPTVPCTGPATPAGPYSFTAYVKHALRLALPHHWHNTDTIPVAVHSPAGEAIPDGSGLRVSIQIRSKGHGWRTVGSAGVVNSVASVHLHIPRSVPHGTVKLRAIARGSNYLTATTAPKTVEVF